MKFHRTSLEDCHTAGGLVVLIDVLRAFSTAAYAFSAGAKRIILAGTVDEALLLRSQIPNSRVMGEVGGLPPAGFDFGNSPTQILQEDLSGLTMIQRTGAGTQGAVRSKNAGVLLASSFVVAAPTVKHILQLNPSDVTFVITGIHYNDEDLACAEFMEKLLKGQEPDIKPFVKRVYDCKDAEQHLDPDRPEFPLSDLDYCTQANRFDFVMPISREGDQLVMRAVQP